LRYADLSEAEVAVIENLNASSDELTPDKKLAARELVNHLLARLRPAERLVIDLLYFQERSVAEIKKITGWSIALVKVRAFRARQRLKQELAKLAASENYDET